MKPGEFQTSSEQFLGGDGGAKHINSTVVSSAGIGSFVQRVLDVHVLVRNES